MGIDADLAANGIPYPLARELIAAQNGTPTTAVRLNALGLPGPLAIELAAQMNGCTKNVNALMSLGLPAGAAVALVAGGGVAATALSIDAVGVGSDGLRHTRGQVYAASVSPADAPIQWTRSSIARNSAPVDIAGATGLTYTSTPADDGSVIGVRGQNGTKAVRRLGPVYAPTKLLDGFETLTGRSTSATLNLSQANVVSSIPGVRLSQKSSGTAAQTSTKDATGLFDPTVDFGDVVSGIVVVDSHAVSSAELQYVRDGIVLRAVLPGVDSRIGVKRVLMAAVADFPGFVPGTAGTATTRMNLTANAGTGQPTFSKAIFGDLRANSGHQPTFVHYRDDGLRSALNIAQAYADAGAFITFAVPVNKITPTLTGGGFFCIQDLLDLVAMGHAVIPNFTPDDDGPTNAVTISNFVTRAVAAANQLIAWGIPAEMVWHGVYSNGADSLTTYVDVTNNSAAYDGAGNVTLGTALAALPRVNYVFEGWDATTGLSVRTRITEVTSTTVFKTAYPFPTVAAGTASINRVNIYDDGMKPDGTMDDTVFFESRLNVALKAAGFKTGRKTVSADPSPINTRRGIPDPLQMPSQSFTGQGFSGTLGQQAHVDRGIKYKATCLFYNHGVLRRYAAGGGPWVSGTAYAADGTTVITQGIGSWYDQDMLYLDYVAPKIASGEITFLTVPQLWRRDGELGAQ